VAPRELHRRAGHGTRFVRPANDAGVAGDLAAGTPHCLLSRPWPRRRPGGRLWQMAQSPTARPSTFVRWAASGRVCSAGLCGTPRAPPGWICRFCICAAPTPTTPPPTVVGGPASPPPAPTAPPPQPASRAGSQHASLLISSRLLPARCSHHADITPSQAWSACRLHPQHNARRQPARQRRQRLVQPAGEARPPEIPPPQPVTVPPRCPPPAAVTPAPAAPRAAAASAPTPS